MKLKKRELLERIAGRLSGITYADLSKAEQQIADLLIANGYAYRGGDFDSIEVKKKKEPV